MHRLSPRHAWIALVALFAVQPLRASAQEQSTQAAPTPQLATPVAYPSSYGLQTPEEALRMQLDVRRLELRDLSRAGRPEHYVRRRVLGFVAIGVGGASAGLATLLAWAATGPDSEKLTGREVAYLGTGVLGGLSVLAVGIWAVTSAKHDNRYRERIVQLGNELDVLTRQLKEARRARKRGAQYNLAPAASFDRGPNVLLRLSIRL